MAFPLPHEQLLADNSLVIFDQSLGQAMFVSHEWSGRSHPEPWLGRKDELKISKLKSYQWPFQVPKLEEPTIYKAYVRPI